MQIALTFVSSLSFRTELWISHTRLVKQRTWNNVISRGKLLRRIMHATVQCTRMVCGFQQLCFVDYVSLSCVMPLIFFSSLLYIVCSLPLYHASSIQWTISEQNLMLQSMHIIQYWEYSPCKAPTVGLDSFGSEQSCCFLGFSKLFQNSKIRNIVCHCLQDREQSFFSTLYQPNACAFLYLYPSLTLSSQSIAACMVVV